MPIKRESIFNNLIEVCESYVVVPNVIYPGNYYGQIREILKLAKAAEPNAQRH